AEAPGASLDVCGSIGRRFKESYPKTVFHGRLDDLDPYYGAAQAVVVPLRVGSGLEIKLVEAMAYGKACVVSSRGLAALPPGCAGAVMPGEDAATFARAVVRALTDDALRRRVGQNALACVREHFNPQKAHGELIERLRLGMVRR
ncbi:MAG: glycosyltransferase family 4 protein, partial [Desulfovibrionaceae bacterium]|nr:glycosyltransferase family 4 protein [Desulfovibrionaceae bacterium]